jgi:hypothetical protein
MCDTGNDCCRGFAKVLLIIINILFFLAGLLMLAFGIALVVAPQKVIAFISMSGDFQDFSSSTGGFFIEIIKASGIFMIILGGIVTIIAFFGFFGACCDSKCMLVTYAIILIIIVLAEVALIIFAAVYPSVFQSVGQTAFNDTLMNEYKSDVVVSSNGTFDESSIGDVSIAWNALQVAFNCCGASNYTDYSKFSWTPIKCDPSNPKCTQAAKVPVSCCKLNPGVGDPMSLNDFIDPKTCMENPSNPTVANQVGCSTSVMNTAKSYIMQYSNIAIGIAAGIVGLEIILITLAFVLCCCREGSSSNKYV